MSARSLFPVVALLLLSILSGGAFAAPVSGKLSLQSRGVAGARLLAWPAATLSFAGAAPFCSPPAGEDGRYRLDLPPGEYYLLAEGPELFSFYGRNPVTVPADGLEGVNIGLLPTNLPLPEEKSPVATGILGRVTADGRALAGASVYLYADLTSRLKGASLGMAMTGADGLFEAEMPAGTYYLLVRLRRSNETAGPLRAGDFVGYFAGNPLRVAEGELTRVAVPVLEVPEKVERLAGSLFGQTSIHGRLLDKAGQPVAGARAVVYDAPTMLNRPLYVSQPTGNDGRFVVSLPHGGTFYLAGRNTLGGAPSPGDLYGTFDARSDHALQVETGQDIVGIDIVLEEMW